MGVPAEYISILEKLVDHFEVRDEVLVKDIKNLKKDTQKKSVSSKTFSDLIARMYLTVGDPSLSFEFGKLIGSDPSGFFGYAIRASKNLEQAIQFEEKYMPVIFNTLKMELNTFGDGRFSIGMQYDAPEAFMPFLSEMVVASFVQAFTDLAGRKNRLRLEESFKDFELKLNYAPPEYVQVYYDYVPFKISFNQAFNEIIGPERLLYSQNRNYDPTLHKLMSDQFDQRLGDNLSDSLGTKVGKLLKKNILEPATIEEIAKHLNMSERTLRRKLQQEKTSFRNILLDIRMEESRSLIKKNKLSLEQIAYALGYQHASTFSSAFKNKYGVSPKQYKDSLVNN